MRSHPGCSRSFSRGLAIALMALACLPVAASAVDEDKVRYIGGTPEHYPLNARPVIFGEKAPKFEGRFDPGTGPAFTFDGGRWGTLSTPYEAISSVDYGWKLRPRPDITFAYGSFPLDALPIHVGNLHRIWIPRCSQTVEPLAHRIGLELELSDALAEGADVTDAARARRKVRRRGRGALQPW